MTVVNVHEAKTRLSELLRAAEKGERVVICRAGVQVAELRASAPVRPAADRLKPHPRLRRIRLDYDPTEPLQADEWPADLR